MHIFINSVTSIRDIIVKARLSPDQVKVVCAITPDNQDILGHEFRIQEPSAPFKRINFYTSTCFEGCDIYDEDGLTFIVSDGRKAKTLIDISTKFTQICGRIRDSKYSGEVIHIFSTTRYSQYISLKEFKMATEKSLQEATEFANDINCLPIKSREMLLNNALILEDEYTIIEDKKLIVDKNRANLDIYNFKICRHIYSKYDNISSEMNSLGYNITSHRYTSITQRSKVPNTRISFKELFDEYTKLKQNKPIFSLENYNESCDIIARKCPLVKEAYDKLGVEKVVGLKYQVGNIRREITKLLPTAEVMRIVKLIDDEVKIHTPIPVKEVKLKLQKIYDILEIPHIAKASDLGK